MFSIVISGIMFSSFVSASDFGTLPNDSSGPAAEPFSIQVMSCDSSGAVKSHFERVEPIYIKGSGFNASTTYNVYFVNDFDWPVPYHASFPSRIAGTSGTITTNSEGGFGPDVVWNSAKFGYYDVIIDVNGNGIYDRLIDVVCSGIICADRVVLLSTDLFIVPEYAFGALLAFLACFTAFVLVKCKSNPFPRNLKKL